MNLEEVVTKKFFVRFNFTRFLTKIFDFLTKEYNLIRRPINFSKNSSIVKFLHLSVQKKKRKKKLEAEVISSAPGSGLENRQVKRRRSHSPAHP